jgi:hypothetical protein
MLLQNPVAMAVASLLRIANLIKPSNYFEKVGYAYFFKIITSG